MIEYRESLKNISYEMLEGFCVGWSKPLNGIQLYDILKNSYKYVLALEDNKVVGFVHALSDKIKFAFIPMLEVLPPYKHQGIGTELMKRLLTQLNEIDNIDLICDKELQKYYKKFDMIPYTGMVIRKR